MKIAIEIPDEEIMEAAKKIVAERIADAMYEGWHEGRAYREDIKQVVREIIRADINNLSERAVTAASKSIENRAVKKLLDKLQEEEE
jgi:hypothetical protein